MLYMWEGYEDITDHKIKGEIKAENQTYKLIHKEHVEEIEKLTKEVGRKVEKEDDEDETDAEDEDEMLEF